MGTKCFSIVIVISRSLLVGPSIDQKVPSTQILPLIFRDPSSNIFSSPLSSLFRRRKSIDSEEHLNLISLADVCGGTLIFKSISNCSSDQEYVLATPTPPYSIVLDGDLDGSFGILVVLIGANGFDENDGTNASDVLLLHTSKATSSRAPGKLKEAYTLDILRCRSKCGCHC